MQALIRAIMLNSWDDPNISEYSRSRDFREELSVAAEVVLRRNRIVIRTKLQVKAISLGHIGHQGVVKTKSLMREKVWFPNMDQMVETTIKECNTCQAANPGGTSAEPPHLLPLPAAPWTEVSVDFAGPFPNGDYLLVVVDDYSRYPEVEIVGTTSAKSTIPRLDAIFACQGIPKQVKNDNGHPFSGHEFANFASFSGFHHKRLQHSSLRRTGGGGDASCVP